MYREAPGASTVPQVLTSFWDAAEEMVEAGEGGVSSIILAVPAFDERWEEWHASVFPALEASVLAAGLGRDLGVVCFHPAYSTPPPEFLRRHRFGHMHPPPKLGAWVQGATDRDTLEAALRGRTEGSGKAELEAGLQWAGSYQRRSPHAMINVLWSRQLEVAENRRDSDNLYVRNIRRLLREGPEELEAAAAAERGSVRGAEGGGVGIIEGLPLDYSEGAATAVAAAAAARQVELNEAAVLRNTLDSELTDVGAAQNASRRKRRRRRTSSEDPDVVAPLTSAEPHLLYSGDGEESPDGESFSERILRL